MKETCAVQTRKSENGFSLLELMIVVAIILIVAAFSVPKLMTEVYSVKLRYSATNLSGELQRARMESVRKNSFYAVQYVAGSPSMEEVVDKNLAVATIPPAVLASNVSVVYGTGSGAPGEAAFTASLNFTTAAAATGLPGFNPRGLPCVRTSPTVCLQTAGQGFVFFLSGANPSGTLGWSAVAVTPSGRCEVFAYDGNNWNQQ